MANFLKLRLKIVDYKIKKQGKIRKTIKNRKTHKEYVTDDEYERKDPDADVETALGLALIL